jgi:tetratricopeptide (TPR) repeat protein
MTDDMHPDEEPAGGPRIDVQRDAYIADVMYVHLPAPAPSLVPRDLPLDVFGFTGRTAELVELDDLITAPSGEHPQTVVISALSGTAGVGKTALAVHWAHRVGERFPDGHLYVDLRGYDPDQPVQPGEALALFLRRLGTDASEIPYELSALTTFYRTLLYTRKMLVVLDNAYDSEQVRPLLPGAPSCFVIVTSRDDLAGLVIRHGAHRINLDALPPADSVRLLRTLIGARVDEEPEAASLLADRCVHLPLALRIAAELAASRPADTLGDLAAELADEQQRLVKLEAGGDRRTAVGAVFSWSYRHLPQDTAQAFRLLGLHPGSSFDAYAVAALLDTNIEHARQAADSLKRAHLIQEISGQRFGVHDLLRAYASKLTTEHDSRAFRKEGTERLFDYYMQTAAQASTLLFPGDRHRLPELAPPRMPGPTLLNSDAAKAWLDTERDNLVAVTVYTSDYGWPSHCGELAAVLRRYLETSAHFNEALTVQTNALRSAQQRADRAGEARELNGIAVIYFRQGRFDEARHHYRSSLDLFHELGDRESEGAVLGNLGSVELRLGNTQSAIECHERSLAIRREVSDRTGEGHTLNNLGFTYERIGRYGDALICLTQSLAIFRDLNDRTDESITLGNLGAVHRKMGRYDEAFENLSRALEISRDAGDRPGEGDVLKDLGLLNNELGRGQEALSQLGQALTISREIGDKTLETESHSSLGEVYRTLHQRESALIHYKSAIAAAAETGNRHEQARALDGIAHILSETGHVAEARQHWQRALAIYIELGASEADQVRRRLHDLGNVPEDQPAN